MWPEESHNNTAPRFSVGSEVAVANGHGPIGHPAAVAALPPSDQPFLISTVNLAHSPRTHIGNKYITNINHNEEIVKGGCLGLEFVSPQHARRLRCSVAVFACSALLIASLLASYFFYGALTAQSVLDIGLNETWYLRRPDWQAMPPSSSYTMRFLKLPVKMAMIGHSATSKCIDKLECIRHVRSIQQDHLERFGDIGPNFLVGGADGLVFEGAGANVVSSTTAGGTSKLVSIMFLGNYEPTQDQPNDNQITHVATLLSALVKDKVLDEGYKLYGYCQIKTYTVSPGQNIMHRLCEYPSWSKQNYTMCQAYDATAPPNPKCHHEVHV